MKGPSGEVELADLTVRYRSVTACDRITLKVGRGVTGLLGPNGAGKTSLFSVLSGERLPSSGQAFVNGCDFTQRTQRHAARGSIGYLPQRFDLPGGMRVDDVVAYAAWCNGVQPSFLQSAVASALDFVDLLSSSAKRVRRLSGGQRQRLGLAASIAHKPSLLLFDEPTVGLDPEQRLQFRRFITDLGQHASVFVATHVLEDVRYSAGRLIILTHGKIAFDGSPPALIHKGQTEVTQPGESDIERGYRSVLNDHSGAGTS